MFDELFDGGYYEFPSFEVAFFSILLSFVLSSVISFTYHYTNRASTLSRNFIQAMMLSSLVTCMVIMAVGNNVAAGFGIMGAIAIVRFRIRIENPRNIIFMFAALSVGIASGVYGYSIAVAGTGVFCIISLLLYVSPYGNKQLNQEFSLSFTLNKESSSAYVKEFLTQRCQDFRMLSMADRMKGDRYEYFITLKSGGDKDVFFTEMKNQEAFSSIKLERSDNLTQL